MTEAVYLAHPVSDYGGPRQLMAVAAILARGFKVENPDQPHHQAAYRTHGMDHFREVVAACDGLAFLRFPCGGIGAGVAKEIETALRLGLPVWEVKGVELVPVGTMMPFPILTVEETRSRLKRACRLRTPHEQPQSTFAPALQTRDPPAQ